MAELVKLSSVHYAHHDLPASIAAQQAGEPAKKHSFVASHFPEDMCGVRKFSHPLAGWALAPEGKMVVRRGLRGSYFPTMSRIGGDGGLLIATHRRQFPISEPRLSVRSDPPAGSRARL